jgi:enamine deaminase RidA (YjgF/YER057c/UK114 family)
VVARQVAHATHTEWYLTARPAADRPPAKAACDAFTAVAGLLAEQGISVLQEKIYGLRGSREEILGQRGEVLSQRGLDAGSPVTFLEGAPASGAAFGGVQLSGVASRPGAGQRVETIRWQGRATGREWIGPDFRQLALASIDGDGGGAARAHSAPRQAQRMFESAATALAAREYTFRHVARTWIYLSRLLDWYGDFNRVRTAHYSAAGLSMAGNAAFPASTGIQARRDSEECLMDLLAIDARPSSGLCVRPVLRSTRQDGAFSYGSAFSRAVVVERRGRKTLHVSGTASIDAEGRSTHAGDAAAQYCDTLLSVAALLEKEGASLSDICQATLFVKTAEVAATCREAARRLCLPPLPAIEIVADVCRPELLVEIEAIAIV